jgi:hypothetical protein
MNTNKTLTRTVALIVMLAAVSAAAHAAGPKIVEPGEKWAGHSYPELASAWTNWLVKEPIATNPAFDVDGSLCGLNQEGDVWFLASTFDGVADRTCEIPAGKGVFLSLGGVFVSFAPEFPSAGDPCLAVGSSVEQVRCDVNDDVPLAPSISFAVTIDGTPIEDLFAYRAQSEPGAFTLVVPDPSFLTDLGLDAGNRYPTVADGYFLFLKPLKPGTHSLQLRMTNPDQSVIGVNYTLIVP